MPLQATMPLQGSNNEDHIMMIRKTTLIIHLHFLSTITLHKGLEDKQEDLVIFSSNR